MIARTLVLGGALVVAVSATARADQCELVDADHATWATKLVKTGSVVAKFCESCGDKVPGTPTTVTSVAAKAVKDKKNVTINGKVVDLACTYLQTGKTTWANVGMLVGCPVDGATPIFTKQAEATTPPSSGPTGVAECDAYFGSIDQLSQCKAFPQEALKAMRDAIVEVRKTIPNVPPDGRKALADGCKAGYDAIKQAAAAMKCTIK